MSLIEIASMSLFILISLKLCLSSWQNLLILVNNFFLPILGIKIEKYTKMKKKTNKKSIFLLWYNIIIYILQLGVPMFEAKGKSLMITPPTSITTKEQCHCWSRVPYSNTSTRRIQLKTYWRNIMQLHQLPQIVNIICSSTSF